MSRALSACVLLIALTPALFAQGRLSAARSETFGRQRSPAVQPSDPAPLNKADGQWFHPSGGNDANPGVGALFLLAIAAATSPFWLPNALLDTMPNDARFPGAPYAGPTAGYLQNPTNLPENAAVKIWGLRAGIEEGHDYGTVNRVGGRVWFDTTSRWGVTTNWDHFFERLGDGRSDEFILGDLMATYRFVQAETVQMHAGLGGRGLFDRYRTRGGFNFLYSADIFPVEPLVISLQGEAGHLNQAFTLRVRAHVGYQFRHGEAFVGYDWLRIGDVDLHGPMIGLRLWF